MRIVHSGAVLAVTLLLGAQAAHAQAREPRPANAKALCKDGTWSTNPVRGVACDTHGGVKSWLRAPGADTLTVPSNAWAKCNDSTYWNHRRHIGACADHGGVKTWLRGEDSPQDRHADSVEATRGDTTVNVTAAGAIAKCKDGRYSHQSERSQACSHHGGVAEWQTQ